MFVSVSERVCMSCVSVYECVCEIVCCVGV